MGIVSVVARTYIWPPLFSSRAGSINISTSNSTLNGSVSHPPTSAAVFADTHHTAAQPCVGAVQKQPFPPHSTQTPSSTTRTHSVSSSLSCRSPSPSSCRSWCSCPWHSARRGAARAARACAGARTAGGIATRWSVWRGSSCCCGSVCARVLGRRSRGVGGGSAARLARGGRIASRSGGWPWGRRGVGLGAWGGAGWRRRFGWCGGVPVG